LATDATKTGSFTKAEENASGDSRFMMARHAVDFSILWPKIQQSMATDPHKSGVDALGSGI
jgi:hypothetical protein